jgi:hypothetical protein
MTNSEWAVCTLQVRVSAPCLGITCHDSCHTSDGGTWPQAVQKLNSLPLLLLLLLLLQAAGYRLHRTYRSQFVKMLQYIDSHFLPELAKSQSSDAQAVSVRLRTYCHVGAFKDPPEGSQLPEFDESSYNRA